MTVDAETIEAQRFAETWSNPKNLWVRFFTNLQHKEIGTRYMVTAFVLFLIGGIQALIMRLQLAQPETTLVNAQTYNELFTMHGTTMMFLFAIPFLEGAASYLMPLLIGCRDLPFPRFNAFNYWCYLLGGLIIYSSYLFALVPDAGWFAYVPLSGPHFSGHAMDFWLFGLTLAEIASVGAAFELAVAILRTRAPGMSLNRLPIFAWTMLSVAFLIIVAFIPLIVASLLLELDRQIGTAFFETSAGGSPLLWQHLFWIFGHPEVYVMFLPGAAIISQVIPVHARHPLAAYVLVVVAVATTAVMSLGLWVHHMYVVGLPSLTLSLFSAASTSIAVASGVQVFAWIATLWLGKPRFTVPMMFAIGFLVTFVAGGVTGVMVASASFDSQVHDTYFVVAHFHYVVLGGMLFPIFAAMHHWWGKVTGRTYSAVLGQVSFWLVFIGFHTTFFPMHLSGLWGMPRRIYTYQDDLNIGFTNLLSTIGAFIMAAGVLLIVINLTLSFFRGGRAGNDPWGGDTLEWTTSSPPTTQNWDRIPIVASRTPAWNPAPPGRYDAAIDEAFTLRPATFRATPMTSVVGGEPNGAVILAATSHWPIIPPVGLAVVAVALLGEWYWLTIVGVLIILVGFAGWVWENETDYRTNDLRPLAGRFPFIGPGHRSIGWWGAGSVSVAILVFVVTLAFSGLYLQVNAAAWPRGSTVDQPLLFGIITVLLAIALAANWWGGLQYKTASAQLVAGFVSIVAGIAALVLVLVLWSGDLNPAAHAYQSVVWTMLAVQATVIVVALASNAVALLSRFRQSASLRPAVLLQGSSLLWGTSILAWLMVWATADLLPILVI